VYVVEVEGGTHGHLDVDFVCWLQDRGWYLLIDICPAGHGYLECFAGGVEQYLSIFGE
jgi:hypothetical protein